MNIKKKFMFSLICIICALIIIGLIGFQKYNNIKDPYKAFQKELLKQKDQENEVQQEIEKEEDALPKVEDKAFNNVINILLLGVDSNKDRELEKMGYRSDTIILTSVDLDTKKIKMLSVPRDTYTVVPGNKNKDKINHAMAFGGGPKKKGNQYAVKAVKDLLGINIHYYITFDMDAVKNIVDTIGGVTIDVERNMELRTGALEKGKHKLDGEQALIYLRDRNTSIGDFARIKQQQKFMLALFQQLKESAEISNILPLYFIVQDKIFTNLKIDQIGALVLLFKDIEEDDIETFTLKGKGIKINSIYYLEIDRLHMEEIINSNYKRINSR